MELTKHFGSVTDFRVKGRCLHDLVDILGLLFIGTLCDCDDLYEIKDFGIDRIAFFRGDLGLKFGNGIPSVDTLERILKHIKPTELESCMRSCAREIATQIEGKQLCVDGGPPVRERTQRDYTIRAKTCTY